MIDYNAVIKTLLEYENEEEWFEFKTSWFEPHAIGEYISALSNAAAFRGMDTAYMVWGIDDDHKIVGTKINYQKSVKNEPFQHYLARLLSPGIAFSFHDVEMDGKRLVLLEIPAAVKVPTSFEGVRYIRIGSSKENAARYPEREAQLFYVLTNGFPSIENTESEYQDLTFGRLFTYCSGRGVELRQENFRKNLGLLTKDGKYNILAQLLSDNCHMSIRIGIFRGETKASPMFAVREFGNTCILNSYDKILEYGDVLNVEQADERNRLIERKEVSLFDSDAFREAVTNAFIHNRWIDGNAPMFTVYSNRIEILSRGQLAPGQTLKGFFSGESVPVNRKLSDLFLQLHLSERTGRGVPIITKTYGRDSIDIREKSIAVTIPFNFLDKDVTEKIAYKPEGNTSELNETQKKVLLEIRNNPDITQPQLVFRIGLGKTTIQNVISLLKERGYISRVGSNKKGYWNVKE